MALTLLNTPAAGQTISSANWIAEFNNLYNNALSLISPLTGDLAAGGNKITGLSLGTVGSPALQFTGDTNTGIYSSAADTLDLAAGGVRALRLNTAKTGVNFLHITPAATNANPEILAKGSEANVNASDDTKGAGVHIFSHGGTEVMRTRALTNGQLIVGSTGATAVAATLTAGTGITIANGAGTITISQGVASQIVVKSANETVNNSTTLQNDDHILFALAANTNYWFDLTLLLTSASANADYKFGWTVPAGCTMFWGVRTDPLTGTWGASAATAAAFALKTEAETLSIGSVAGSHGAILSGIVRNGATTGNLQFQWAQLNLTAEDNIINADSFLQIIELP